jgi:predicted nucleic acid-binding Zn ribbon protein
VEEIGKSLPRIFKRHMLRPEPQLAEILPPLWAQVAGKTVAEHSRPVAFCSGELLLSTPSDTWAAQLGQLAAEIVAAVNAFLGAPLVKELRVRLEPELPLWEAGRRKEFQPDPRNLRGSSCKIPAQLDPETKDILERSFSKYFARGGKWQA